MRESGVRPKRMVGRGGREAAGAGHRRPLVRPLPRGWLKLRASADGGPAGRGSGEQLPVQKVAEPMCRSAERDGRRTGRDVEGVDLESQSQRETDRGDGCGGPGGPLADAAAGRVPWHDRGTPERAAQDGAREGRLSSRAEEHARSPRRRGHAVRSGRRPAWSAR